MNIIFIHSFVVPPIHFNYITLHYATLRYATLT